MSQKNRIIFIIFFIAIVFYTGYGILQLGKQSGGPCGDGLLLILLLFPSLLICSVLLGVTFSWLKFTNETSFITPIILTIISLLIWTFWAYNFLDYKSIYEFLYFGLFELFNILLLLVFIRVSIKNKKNKGLESQHE